MEQWEQVVEEFLRPWRQRDDARAALLYGSHVDGAAGVRSDIDLLIIVADGARNIVPALCYLRGYLVEAFFITTATARAAFAQHHQENSRVTAVQWTTGRILFDRDGTAAALREEARQWLAKPFERPREPAAAYWMRRALWQGADHLRSLHAAGAPDFVFVAHQHVHKVYTTYAKFLGQPVNDPHRIRAALVDDRVRRRFGQEPFPDAAFVAGIIAAIEERRPANLMALAQALTDHVLKRMGGFEVPTCST